ncbi:hypothetical protein [Nonomuraea guangzhouensis]|uniref:Uncharacterized protein n=1 Tax=Nonomuraea guangzhouensis TaxID=1291555 RepID=A0ABW4GAH8_9ACTN|nr:hypothetical protein [Nonomuraea guangzhouensis]
MRRMPLDAPHLMLGIGPRACTPATVVIGAAWAAAHAKEPPVNELFAALEEYQAFHRSVIAELPRVHVGSDGNPCDREHDALCVGQLRHIAMRIDVFLADHVPDDRRGPLDLLAA